MHEGEEQGRCEGGGQDGDAVDERAEEHATVEDFLGDGSGEAGGDEAEGKAADAGVVGGKGAS